jgi:hypothetical protein
LVNCKPVISRFYTWYKELRTNSDCEQPGKIERTTETYKKKKEIKKKELVPVKLTKFTFLLYRLQVLKQLHISQRHITIHNFKTLYHVVALVSFLPHEFLVCHVSFVTNCRKLKITMLWWAPMA